jgi:hypothetical protein
MSEKNHHMQDYELIRFPILLTFKEIGKKELGAYYAWFMSILSDRLEILRNTVNATGGFEDWQSDYSPDSLNKLGHWFANNVQTRQRSKEEKAEIYRKAPPWFQEVKIEDKELTDETFSLAVDVGIYLSQVFLRNNKTLFWGQHLARKDDVDYGHAVLLGFGKLFFSPLRMTVALAYGIVYKRRTAEGLRELYDTWVKLIPVQAE